MGIRVLFDPPAMPEKLLYAVIVSCTAEGQWVFCRHRARDSWECPGGHMEPGESPEAAARRELWEETGAVDYTLTCLGPYGVAREDAPPSWGMLYCACIHAFESLPPMEIAEVRPFDRLPEKWTYPQIQPHLVARAAKALGLPNPFKEE